MAAQKHLHELLKEDQEPFILLSKTQMVKKRKSVLESSNFPKYFCKNACFFSFYGNSPEMRRSPFYDFQSPAKIPVRTAAAVKIQKQSSKAKTRSRNDGFGVFGSMLKKLTHRNRKHEIGGDGVSVKKSVEESCDGISCSYNSCLYDFEKGFCESPFRFVLQRSPSSGDISPEFLSPASSPSRHKTESCEADSLKKLQEEEEKEQNSPVSVLDPPFDDDDDGHEEDRDQDNNLDYECSFATIQRAKQQLLHKLCRFERLAGLDPIELEKRILEQDDEQEEEQESEDGNNNGNLVLNQVLRKSNFHDHTRRIPEDFKRLVSDLIGEEGRDGLNENGREDLPKRVCKRLEKWKEVEMNTIDMMVEQDYGRELEMWKRSKEERGETAMQIEIAIFGILVEEFSEELGFMNGIQL